MRRELIITVHDLLVDTKGVVIVEGRVAGQHLENQDSERPPIHILVVALGLDNLRSEVLWCATKSVGLVFDYLGETKIGDLNVALTIDEQVLWLEVSVGDFHLVKVIES